MTGRGRANTMRTARRRAIPVVAAILYALASVLVGLAHRPAASVAPEAAAVTVMLPDGSVPVICGPAEPGDAGRATAAICGACLLVAAPGLPPPAAVLESPGRASCFGPPVPAVVWLPLATWGRPRSRAPPTIT